MKTYEEYKVSGVKWLGKVPKHWEICRFKDFISLQTQTSLSENKIGLENIECATGKFIETNSEFEGNGIAFDVGDVIYGKLRPYLKKVWLSTFNGNAVGDFFVFSLKSATKLFSVLLASKRPLITELADKLRLKYPLLPTISPCPTMRLEAIRSIIPISCRRYPKSV